LRQMLKSGLYTTRNEGTGGEKVYGGVVLRKKSGKPVWGSKGKGIDETPSTYSGGIRLIKWTNRNRKESGDRAHHYEIKGRPGWGAHPGGAIALTPKGKEKIQESGGAQEIIPKNDG